MYFVRNVWTASWVALCFFSSIFASGKSCWADIFHLTSGNRIDGLLIREDAATVSFEIEGAGLWTIDRQTITEIEKESPGTYWIRQGEKHAAENQIERARSAFLKAQNDPEAHDKAVRRVKDLSLVDPGYSTDLSAALSRIEPARMNLPPESGKSLEEIPARIEPKPQPAPKMENPVIDPPVQQVSLARSSSARSARVVTRPSGRTNLDDIIRRYAQLYGVDPLLVRAIITVESEWDPKATSSSGAQGLMQLMPGTATKMGIRNAYDPEQNIRGGIKYLAHLFSEFDNLEPEAQWIQVVAAYHAGPTRLREVGDFRQIPATNRYTQKVTRAYQKLHREMTEKVAYVDLLPPEFD